MIKLKNKMIGKIFKILINTILGLLIALGILVVLSFVPIAGNYRIFTVQSGSMEPTIKTGSLIFSKPENDYNVGDIITKKTKDPKITVTHRIVEKTEENGVITFKTKGDANNAEDSETTSQNEIIGKMILKIPYLGYPVSFAKTMQGLVLIIIIPAVIIIYDEAQKIGKEIKKGIKKRKENKSSSVESAENGNDLDN